MATRALLSRLYAELKQRDSKKQSDQTAFFLGYKTLSCSFVIIIHYSKYKRKPHKQYQMYTKWHKDQKYTI